MADPILSSPSKHSGAWKKPSQEAAAQNLNSPKISLKSKWITVFEEFLSGQDPSQTNKHFWEELLLLKVHGQFLIQQLCLKSTAEIVGNWPIWSVVVFHSVVLAGDPDRKRNALLILNLLFSGILHHRFSNWGQDVRLVLFGDKPRAVETVMACLMKHIRSCLSPESSATDQTDLRRLSVRLLITIVTANNNMEENFLIPHLMDRDLVPMFQSQLRNPQSGITKRDILSILLLLVIYNDISIQSDVSSTSANDKAAEANLFISLIEDNGAGSILTSVIELLEYDTFNSLAHAGAVPNKLAEHRSGFSVFSSFIGSWFTSKSPNLPLIGGITNNSSVSDSSTLSASPSDPNNDFPVATSPTDCFSVNPGMAILSIFLFSRYNKYFLQTLFFPTIIQDMISSSEKINKKLPSPTAPPLLIDFLELSKNMEISFLLHDDKIPIKLDLFGDKRRNSHSEVSVPPVDSVPIAAYIVELCQIFLRYHIAGEVFIAGDSQWGCELITTCLDVIHRVICFQKKMRIRVNYPWRGMWNTLLRFATHFSAAVINKTSELRPQPTQALTTPESPGPDAGNSVLPKMWAKPTAVIPAPSSPTPSSNFNSLVTDITVLPMQSLLVLRKVLTIFNLAITFGDHFLPSNSDYDDLYYEIIRFDRQWKGLVDSIDRIEGIDASCSQTSHSMLINPNSPSYNSSSSSDSGINPSSNTKENSTIPAVPVGGSQKRISLARELYNIRSILHHFGAKLTHFQVANPNTPLVGPLVINIIKSNYETLQLQLQDDIDQFVAYDPNSLTERKLMRRYAKILVQDIKLLRYTEIEAALEHKHLISSSNFLRLPP